MTANVTLDYALLHDERLGDHRLPEAALKELSPRVQAILKEIADERASGVAHRFRELPYQDAQVEQVSKLADRLRPSAENLIVLGIGGSALGNIALQSALAPQTYNLLDRKERGGPRLFVLDNVDPMMVGEVVDFVGRDWAGTIVNVVSKSGETAETSAQFLLFRELMTKALGEAEAKKRIIVTTDEARGTMRGVVDREGYESLVVPDGVGGRFSVLSHVGLFSAAMCGIDIKALLAGAAAMDKIVSAPDPMTNPAALLAMIHHWYTQPPRNKSLHVMMPYSQALRDMADWYRQLWAESLGKIRPSDGKCVGATPIKALGATDQHSQVQLYREGLNDKVITFLEVESFERDITVPKAFEDVEAMRYLGYSSRGTLAGLLSAEKEATQLALLKSQRPSLTIRFPKIDAHTVGQFIYLYECVIPIMGKLWEIDPYDQPAVELGKQLTFHLMGRKGYEKSPMEQ